jgi:hypothetical protein
MISLGHTEVGFEVADRGLEFFSSGVFSHLN